MPSEVATGRLRLELRFQTSPDDGPEPRSTDVSALLAGLSALYDACFHAAVGNRPVVDVLAARAQPTLVQIAGRAWTQERAPEHSWVIRRMLNVPMWDPEVDLSIVSIAPPDDLRLVRLRLGSPLEVVEHIPWAYLQIGGALWLLIHSIETWFNAPQRVRVDRARLRAAEAAHVADEREAELRATLAAQGLDALRGSNPPFELEDGDLTVGE